MPNPQILLDAVERQRFNLAKRMAQKSNMLSVEQLVLLLDMWDSDMLNVEICAYFNYSSEELQKIARFFGFGRRRIFRFPAAAEQKRIAAQIRKNWTKLERQRRLVRKPPAAWSPPRTDAADIVAAAKANNDASRLI